MLKTNQVYLDEINRLNQDIAKKKNDHRETKKELEAVIEILRDDIQNLSNLNEELKEKTKKTKSVLSRIASDL